MLANVLHCLGMDSMYMCSITMVKNIIYTCAVQVLHNHAKGDVFDMVKNLNLPVEHGGGSLLKKLQALGLHSNRYKITRHTLFVLAGFACSFLTPLILKPHKISVYMCCMSPC